MQNRGIILLLITTLLLSCSPKALREAEEVVAQADSLRAAGQMYGIDAGDSATLAQAYETLGSLSLFNFHFSPSYAHACYHYGRLLREKDNPVEAMQCFINATHSHTRDYHILGRVYSNMGDIAHLAGEFPLAYDMYERSGQMYLHNGDSLQYYYDLSNMAFELAEQGKKEESYAIIHDLEQKQSNENLLFYQLEIQSVACKKVGQYDSVLYYTAQLLDLGYDIPSVLLNRAQAYSFRGEKDSAVHYANLVLSITDEIYEQTNALYILTNDDDAKNIDAVRETASERADSQRIIENRKSQIAQAVQLLEQDLARKPNLAWLYAICATLAVVGLVAFLYVYRKRRQHTLLAQQIEDLTIQNKEAAVQHEKIINDVEKQKRNIADEIEQNCHLITRAESFPQNIHWKSYNKMCTVIDKRFYLLASKLHTKYKLNETETRLCVLTLLDCKYELIADLLYRSNSSIGTLKIRVAKKIGTTAKNLRMYLIENECVN